MTDAASTALEAIKAVLHRNGMAVIEGRPWSGDDLAEQLCAELNTLSAPPSQDKGEALAEELERLREEVDRFRRPRDRALSTEDPITPLDSFQPRHLLGLALLFRQWCDSGLWGRPEEAELAARQVETAYSMLTALSTAQASEREQIVAWLRSDTAPGVALRTEYASAIERGDYLATPVEPSPVDVERGGW